jgi:hypothetical protein
MVDELRLLGYEVVLTGHGKAEGIDFISFADIINGNFEHSTELNAPFVARCRDEDFRHLAIGLSRIAYVPFTLEQEFMFGGGLSPDSLESYARLATATCVEVLKHFSVQEIWFAVAPHSGHDQAMALAAKMLGLQVIVARQLHFPAKFAFEVKQGGVVVTPKLKGFKAWSQGAIEPSLFYMKPRAWDPLTVAVPRRIRQAFANIRSGNLAHIFARCYRWAIDRRYWKTAFALGFIDSRTRSTALTHWNCLTAMEKESGKRDFVLPNGDSSPFIYFPLHYEPEANVDVYGGDYPFQLDALAALASVLPDGWKVLVKENPAQRFARRSPAFYRLFSMIPNVNWVSDETPTKDLIDGCALVGTVLGTAGYEAMLKGKACVFFGDPWYKDLPGAHRFHPGIDIQALVDFRVNRDELDAAVNAAVSDSADGVFFKRFLPMAGPDGASAMMSRATARSLVRISRAALDM